MTLPHSDDEQLRATLQQQMARLDVSDPPAEEQKESVAVRRARRGQLRGTTEAKIALVRADGVLRWTYQRPSRAVGMRRARRAGTLVGAREVFSHSFREAPPNKVVEKLELLDQKLTPNQGLRQWEDGAFRPLTAPAQTPRALLFVHGTFSKSDMFFDELRSCPEGKAFLDRAAATYKQILAFDHPTLSMSPMLNAIDLDKALRGYSGTLDVICHSRGGLVASWWLAFGVRKARRVVFVASPLEGTNLASPARLKETLDILANIADATQKLASAGAAFVPPAAPLLGVAAGLMQVLGAGLSVGARSPLLDAGVAVVAGLASQSRVKNNQELIRLHQMKWGTAPEFFAVRSDFEPGSPEDQWWQFWKRLRKPLTSFADVAVDSIFDGPNDLVVDVASMTRVLEKDLDSARIWDFGTNNRVHHCNYFAQPETAAFLTKKLLEQA